MLRLVASLVGVCVALLASTARAACEDGVRLFPTPGATVPVNVQFVLEGVSGEQERVSALIGSSELALFGGKEAVPVAVEKGWTSTMNRVAVRLKPRRALEPNTEYSLGLSRVLPKGRLLNDTFGDNTPRWRTGPAADGVLPKFTTRPAVSEGFYQRTKDGLTRSLKLRTQVNDLGAAYLVISMVRARGMATKQQYFVPVEGEAATVGHDVCSGSFGFDDGRAYKLTVELFDAAGNRSGSTVTLELSAPRPTTPEPDAEKK